MPSRNCVACCAFLIYWSGVPAAGPVTSFGQAPTGEATSAEPSTAVQDATVASLFQDFVHYARLGRFTLADTYAQALLAHPDLDAVEVMELANRDKKSIDTLLILIQNSTIAESASRVMELIHEGEFARRQDAERIKENIAKLGGNPQQEFFATRYLAEAGEFAVPPMVGALLDEARLELRPRVVHALSKLGRPAVGPLVQTLEMKNHDVRMHVARALGEIGYPQAIPYLRRVGADSSMPDAVRKAAADAIARIEELSGRALPGSAEDVFYWLAEKYYNEEEDVRADPRLAEAHVWYWDTARQALRSTVVAQPLFGSIMAMRCCEDALVLRNDHADALALWLASNFRRESRLSLNVESGDPTEQGGADATHPADFPRGQYFARAAGPRYAHLVLARAVRDRDAAVALGAIEALRETAGESSLLGGEDYKQPLVQALRFPVLLVRLRAALALGAALPKSPFEDSQHVVPLLAQAITLTGDEQVVLIDPDVQNRNRIADTLRAGDRVVIAEGNLYAALEQARTEFQTVSGFFLASDVAQPGAAQAIAELRGQFQFSQSPVVLLTKPGAELVSEDLAGRDSLIELVRALADDASIEGSWNRVRGRTGQTSIDKVLARGLAVGAIETLRKIALDGRTVFDVNVAEAALTAALARADEGLQISAAAVLALGRTPSAQQAIATLALEAARPESLRIPAFASLAESAKVNGNLLRDDQVAALVELARTEADLTLRTAASQALGAVNLSSNKASEIIRSYRAGS